MNSPSLADYIYYLIVRFIWFTTSATNFPKLFILELKVNILLSQIFRRFSVRGVLSKKFLIHNQNETQYSSFQNDLHELQILKDWETTIVYTLLCNYILNICKCM